MHVPFVDFATNLFVYNLDRERPSLNVNNRRGVFWIAGKVLGKTGCVDRGGSDHQSKVGTLGQNTFQVAQQKIDIERAFMSFVHDQ